MAFRQIDANAGGISGRCKAVRSNWHDRASPSEGQQVVAGKRRGRTGGSKARRRGQRCLSADRSHRRAPGLVRRHVLDRAADHLRPRPDRSRRCRFAPRPKSIGRGRPSASSKMFSGLTSVEHPLVVGRRESATWARIVAASLGGSRSWRASRVWQPRTYSITRKGRPAWKSRS